MKGSAFSWGTVEQAMDPDYSAGSFYKRLVAIDGWEELGLGIAAQTVQASAHPTLYNKWQTAAEAIVEGILGADTGHDGGSTADCSAAATDGTDSFEGVGDGTYIPPSSAEA